MTKKFLTTLLLACFPFVGFAQEQQVQQVQQEEPIKSCSFWDNWYAGANLNALTYIVGDFAHGGNPFHYLNDHTGAFGVGFTLGKTFCDNTWGLYGDYFYNGHMQIAKVNNTNVSDRVADFRVVRVHLGINWNVSRTFKKNDDRIVDFGLQAGFGAITFMGTHIRDGVNPDGNGVRNPVRGSVNLGTELIGHISKSVDIRFRSDLILGPSDMDIPNDDVPFKLLWNNSIGVSYNFSAPRNKHTIDDVYEKVNNLDKKMDDFMENQQEVLKNELQGVKNEIKENNSNVIKKLDEMNGKIDKLKTAAPVCPQNIQPVFFGFSKTNIDKDQEYALDAVATTLRNSADAKLTITGYADPTGTDQINKRISEKRTEACKKILVDKHGINPDRITTKGMGAVNNFSSSTNVLNRRAEFTIQ